MPSNGSDTYKYICVKITTLLSSLAVLQSKISYWNPLCLLFFSFSFIPIYWGCPKRTYINFSRWITHSCKNTLQEFATKGFLYTGKVKLIEGHRRKTRTGTFFPWKTCLLFKSKDDCIKGKSRDEGEETRAEKVNQEDITKHATRNHPKCRKFRYRWILCCTHDNIFSYTVANSWPLPLARVFRWAFSLFSTNFALIFPVRRAFELLMTILLLRDNKFLWFPKASGFQPQSCDILSWR